MRIPSASILANPIGSAPGWWVECDGHILALMPGVPSEMRRMWTDQLAPRLAERFGLSPLHRRMLKTFGIGESAVAEKLGDLLEIPGDGVIAGIYARDDGVHVRFSTRSDPELLDGPMARATQILGEDVFGTDADTLAGAALKAIAAAGLSSLATVESGTEGALLAILAAHDAGEGEARLVTGILETEMQTQEIPRADARLRLRLDPPAALGRSRVHVSLHAGRLGFEERQLRIHGSGPQRLRRAAFAALDQVRRAR
jgi:nicotinamide-nucleotide amidase